MNLNVLDFGAVGDGKTLNTKALQAAIDACHSSGGGRVTVPAGCFVTGTIWLKSNVELYLQHNAVLKGSENLDDYNDEDAYPQNFHSLSECWCGKHLIIALEQENVSINGEGAIEGVAYAVFRGPLRGKSNYGWEYGYYTIADGDPLRPGQMVCFIECRHVRVSGITLRDSSCWNLWFHGCDFVKVSGLTILGNKRHCNNDGIDIDACSYVTVSDCLIQTGDDAIAIRCDTDHLSPSKRQKKCEYITVSNCVLSSSSCSIRFGVGRGELHHVSVSDLVIPHSGEGFTFMTGYHGRGCVNIHDVLISNVTANDVGVPLYIRADEAAVERITVDNFHSDCKCCVKILSEIGSVRRLTLHNVELYDREGNLRFPERAAEERKQAILNFKGASDVILDGVTVFARDSYFEDRSLVLHCEDTNISHCRLLLRHRGQTREVSPETGI